MKKKKTQVFFVPVLWCQCNVFQQFYLMLELEELILWTVNPQLWGDAESPDDDVETLDGTWTPGQNVISLLVHM